MTGEGKEYPTKTLHGLLRNKGPTPSVSTLPRPTRKMVCPSSANPLREMRNRLVTFRTSVAPDGRVSGTDTLEGPLLSPRVTDSPNYVILTVSVYRGCCGYKDHSTRWNSRPGTYRRVGHVHRETRSSLAPRDTVVEHPGRVRI